MKKTLLDLLVFSLIFTPLQFTHAATSPSGGYVDVFERSSTEAVFEVRGWAYHPGHPEQDVVVDVHIDGVRVTSIAPESLRQDVIAYTGVDHVYGFIYELPSRAFTCSSVCPDTHDVQLVSRDLETGEQFPLTHGVQSVHRADVGMMGYLDRISMENPQDPEIFVRGWVTNAAHPSSTVDVYVMIDGQLAGYGTANISRTDVRVLYNLSSTSTGFAIAVEEMRSSSSDTGMSVLVYAFDANTNRFIQIGSDYYYFED